MWEIDGKLLWKSLEIVFKIEAGLRLCVLYPGLPSTELICYDITSIFVSNMRKIVILNVEHFIKLA